MTWKSGLVLVLLGVFGLHFCFGDIILSRDHSTVEVDFKVKTESHPEFGFGFSDGYTIDGVEGPSVTIKFNPLNKLFPFRFQTKANVPCDYHPLYLTTDPSGQNEQSSVGEIFNGTVERNAADQLCSPGVKCACDGGSLVWTPQKLSSELPEGVSFYYQCRVHSKMGGPITVIEASPCDILTYQLSANAFQLFQSQNSIVPSLFTQINATLTNFFDGSRPGTSDLLEEPRLSESIEKHAQYFAQLLGCTDGTIANYTGESIEAVHATISSFVTTTEFDLFVSFIMDKIQGYLGTNDFNYLNPRIKSLLISQKPYICKGDANCRVTLCDLYTDFAGYTGSSEVWLAKIVNSTLNKLTQSLYPSFNGEVGPNYFVEGTARTTFIDKMVAFLGRELECSQNGFPTYSLTDQQLVDAHSSMTIDQLQYEGFIKSILNSFNDEGMAPSDQQRVEAILTRTGLAGICNQPNCDPTFQRPITYVVTVQKPKDQHPWKDGYNAAYVIDGQEARELVLTVGRTYIFKNNGGCEHPFYISTSEYGGRGPAGQPIGPVTEGITDQGVSNFFQICNGNALYFTPTASQAAGYQLYYQCLYHERMGYKLTVCTEDNLVCSTGSPPPATTQQVTGNTPVSSAVGLSPALALIFALLLSLRQ